MLNKRDDSKHPSFLFLHPYFLSNLTGNEYSVSTLHTTLAIRIIRLFLLLYDLKKITNAFYFNLVKCGALWIYWRAIWFFSLISWCGEITYLIFIWMLTFLSVYKPNLIIMSFCLSLKFVSELSVFIFCLGYFKSVFISVVSCTFLFLCCSCWVWVSGLW